LALSACARSSSSSSAEEESVVKTLSVSTDQVVSVSDFTEVTTSDHVTEVNSFDLPIGSILYQDASVVSAVIMPSESGRQLARFGFLDTDSGALIEALADAERGNDGYVLYDFRANDQIAIWDEVNLTTQDWCVYVASVDKDHALKNPTLVESGDVNYDPPLLCVSGKRAFYTVLPYESGSASTKDSYLKCATTSGSPEVVYTSHGRMITNPQASDGIVTFVPRADTTGVYYQLTAIEADTYDMVAAEILPKGLKVSDAVYMGGAFAFNIEQTYSTGGGLSSFGTYRAIDDGSYLRFNRTPTDTPALMGGYLYVKSTRTIAGVDPDKRTYFNITAVEGCIDYGDFLASVGSASRLVTFTNVPKGDGSGEGATHVRVFKSV